MLYYDKLMQGETMPDLSHMKICSLSGVPDEEFSSRREKVAKVLEEKKLDGMVFFSASSIFYLTGCALFQTERPIVYVFRPGGTSALLVPRLELEHALDTIRNCEIVSYPEYPGERHPMEYLIDLVRKMGLEKSQIAADAKGYPGVMGYRGKGLDELMPEMKITLLSDLIGGLKVYKSEFEIELMKESARWSQLAHKLLQEYTRPGLSEIEVASRASAEATAVMLKTLGPRFKLSGLDGGGCYAGYRGQVGPHSYFPHSSTINAIFKKGDTLVTGAAASILGYLSELERVMFVGEPSKEQEYFYNMAVEAQNAAFSMIKPGNKCSDVDGELRRFFEEHELQKYWRHHTGHSIGTGDHEAPFFDVGDHTLIEPGMCFTVEPGIYVEGLGGFRLSDTLVVKSGGFELITYYDRNIEGVICVDK
jgi:Xaa-Pro aminopeptidase